MNQWPPAPQQFVQPHIPTLPQQQIFTSQIPTPRVLYLNCAFQPQGTQVPMQQAVHFSPPATLQTAGATVAPPKRKKQKHYYCEEYAHYMCVIAPAKGKASGYPRHSWNCFEKLLKK
jgi:hypothetical protein